MTKKGTRIEDNSGDRKYFTIIPNYILNHSTMWDREVYVQMKRIAGERGECWMSQTNLAERCGMSINRLKKSIKYLLDHGWIEKKGTKQVGTSGGKQPVTIYSIVDLWEKNVEYYKTKGVSGDDTPKGYQEVIGVSRDAQRGITDDPKGVSPGDDKEEPYKEEPYKKNTVRFEEFWNLYPKKVGKKLATIQWKKLSDKDCCAIIEDIPKRMNDDKWKRGFIKDPIRYLRDRQWEDEILKPKNTNNVYKNKGSISTAQAIKNKLNKQ